MRPPELSDGPDLLLRSPVREDGPAIVAQCQDPVFRRWTAVPEPYAEADAHDFLSRVAHGWQSGAVATFAVEYQGRFAGSINLQMDGIGGAEIGYGLSPWARGQGLMTRAVRLMLAWGFDELRLTSVHWKAQVGNWPSRRTATRCGFRVQGTVPGLLEHRGQRCDGWFGSIRRGDPLTGEPDTGGEPSR